MIDMWSIKHTILLAIVHDSDHVDDTVSDQVVLLGILVQTGDIERCGVLGIALVHEDVDLCIQGSTIRTS